MKMIKTIIVLAFCIVALGCSKEETSSIDAMKELQKETADKLNGQLNDSLDKAQKIREKMNSRVDDMEKSLKENLKK
jgi:uncharacterized protein YoxC